VSAVAWFVAGGLFALLVSSLVERIETRARRRRIRAERLTIEDEWRNITAGEWPR